MTAPVLVLIMFLTRDVESQPMRLVYNDASNVAVPLFEPSADYTAVAFDKHNRMNIQSYYDDTVVPVATGTKAYYRWYVCETVSNTSPKPLM